MNLTLRNLARSCLLAAACLAASGLPTEGQTKPATAKSPQLVLLSGEAVAVKSLTIDAAGALGGEGVPEGLTLDDLRRIELPSVERSATSDPTAVIELTNGGRILASGVTVADDKCLVRWANGEPLQLPIDAVRSIRLEPQRQDAEFEKAVAAPDPNADRLFLKVDDKQIERIAGLVESLSETTLTLEVAGQTSEIPRGRVFGIVIAQPALETMSPPRLVSLRDGSVLGCESLTLADGQFTLELGTDTTVMLPWEAVIRVDVRSDRVVFLSDLKPIAEEQQVIVTLPRPWQRDKSAAGGPLKLGTRTYDKGIGVHARAALTFDTSGAYDVLAATIGLDAIAGGKGDCVFAVLADGEPVFTRRMRGTDPPHKLEVPIRGRQQVTLVVEPGEGLDLGDHGNWCDARFIKNK